MIPDYEELLKRFIMNPAPSVRPLIARCHIPKLLNIHSCEDGSKISFYVCILCGLRWSRSWDYKDGCFTELSGHPADSGGS